MRDPVQKAVVCLFKAHARAAAVTYAGAACMMHDACIVTLLATKGAGCCKYESDRLPRNTGMFGHILG